MDKISFFALVCACFLGGVLQISEVSADGCGGQRRDCTDDADCPGKGIQVCLRNDDGDKKCYPCPCRLPEQCYLDGHKVKCHCGFYSGAYGDNCECPIITACPQGWLLNGSSCYLFDSDYGNQLGWDDAKQYCENIDPLRQSSLVKVDDEDEHYYIQYQLYVQSAYGFYWIGGRYSPTTADYRWTDDTQVTGSFWKPGQPGAIPGCMNYNAFGDYLWSVNTDCSETAFHFICEIKI